MPTPHRTPESTRPRHIVEAGRPASAQSAGRPWRCHACSKMLGVIADGQLHIRFARHHEYLVALPAVATCKSCGAINRLNITPHI